MELVHCNYYFEILISIYICIQYEYIFVKKLKTTMPRLNLKPMRKLCTQM